MRRLVVLLLAVSCTAPAARAPDGAGTPLASVPAEIGARAAARVLGVIDGDTIVVGGRGGPPLTVRLIGVDTPQTKHPRLGVQCFGRDAADYVRDALDGARVILEYDVERTDRYGRALAYVYVGDALFNLELVERGFATVLTVPPNVAHADELVAAQRRARAAQRGLWSACF